MENKRLEREMKTLRISDNTHRKLTATLRTVWGGRGLNEPEFGKIRKRLERITPETQRIAKIFKTYMEKAIDELGPSYIVDLRETLRYVHALPQFHYHLNSERFLKNISHCFLIFLASLLCKPFKQS